MNTYSVISYKAKNTNVPALINQYLVKEYQIQENEVLIFIQEELLNDVLDKTKLFNEYTNFIKEWNLPFSYYFYYGKFNRVLPQTANTPNPKYEFKTSNGIISISNQLAYGLLVLNISLLKTKNILFDDSYPQLFYLQDFAEKCYKNNLWISNCFFVDIHESWKFFKEESHEYFTIDGKKFLEEKERYNKINPQYKNPNEFIEDFKKYLHPEKVTVKQQAVQSSPQIIDITTLKGE